MESIKAFLSKVNRSDSCWLWNGYIKPSGYGQYGRSSYAHVISYELFKGNIPDGLEVDHTCNVRSCVNPDHLQLLSPDDNKHRRVTDNPLCKNGHNSWFFDKRGTRWCRICENKRRSGRVKLFQ